MQDTPAEEKLVGSTGKDCNRDQTFLKGPDRDLRLVQLASGSLPTFGASNTVHHPIKVGKDSVLVYLG